MLRILSCGNVVANKTILCAGVLHAESSDGCAEDMLVGSMTSTRLSYEALVTRAAQTKMTDEWKSQKSVSTDKRGPIRNGRVSEC